MTKAKQTHEYSNIPMRPFWSFRSEQEENITLYEGSMELVLADETLPGRGKISLQISPTVDARASIETNAPTFAPMGYILPLRVPVAPKDLRFAPTRHERANGASTTATMSGRVLDDIELTPEDLTVNGKQSLARVRFHLLNVRSLFGEELSDRGITYPGRVTFNFGKWQVILDSTRMADSDQSQAWESRKYVVTCIGQLQRTDGKLFSPKAARSCLEFLTWFFTFAFGFWCPPTAVVGYRTGNETLWWLHIPARTSQTYGRSTWVATIGVKQCLSAAEPFYKLYSKSESAEWLRLLIGLYVQANVSDSAPDLALANGQIALELLADVIAQERNQLIEAGSFYKLDAADRLRIALLWANIPPQIPETLKDLIQSVRKEALADGPKAITELRNRLVHPTRSHRSASKATTDHTRYQALLLTLQYIELLTLRILDYVGPYASRIGTAQCPPGDGIRVFYPVPWARPGA